MKSMPILLAALLVQLSVCEDLKASDFHAGLEVKAPYGDTTLVAKGSYSISKTTSLVLNYGYTILENSNSIHEGVLGYELKSPLSADINIASRLQLSLGHSWINFAEDRYRDGQRDKFLFFDLSASLGPLGIGFRNNFIKESIFVDRTRIKSSSVYPYLTTTWSF